MTAPTRADLVREIGVMLYASVVSQVVPARVQLPQALVKAAEDLAGLYERLNSAPLTMLYKRLKDVTSNAEDIADGIDSGWDTEVAAWHLTLWATGDEQNTSKAHEARIRIPKFEISRTGDRINWSDVDGGERAVMRQNPPRGRGADSAVPDVLVMVPSGIRAKVMEVDDDEAGDAISRAMDYRNHERALPAPKTKAMPPRRAEIPRETEVPRASRAAPSAERVAEFVTSMEPSGRFGQTKVFIWSVWDKMRRAGEMSMSLDEFKRWLVEKNKGSELDLARADLVGVMDPVLVANSETSYKGAVFHFIVDRSGYQRRW